MAKFAMILQWFILAIQKGDDMLSIINWIGKILRGKHVGPSFCEENFLKMDYGNEPRFPAVWVGLGWA